MPERSQKFKDTSSARFSKLKWLEKIKLYQSLKKGAIKNEVSDSNQRKPNSRRVCKLRCLEVAFSISREWSNMGTESDPSGQATVDFFSGQTKLQQLKIKMMKIPVNFEGILLFFPAISPSKNLHHLEWEFLNCRVTDMEIIAFAQGLTKARQLEYFSLKVIQNSNVSEDCIEKIVEVMSKLDNLSKFDLYFRKLNLPPKGILELGKRILYLPNIDCSCSKESIHIFRKSYE